MNKLEELSNELSNLTILEAVELVKILENKWGVSSSNIEKNNSKSENINKIDPEEKKEIKTEFDVFIVNVGDKKIQVVKVIRELIGLGLKESKDIVEKLPGLLKSKILKEEADNIKNKLEEQGAKVEIK